MNVRNLAGNDVLTRSIPLTSNSSHTTPPLLIMNCGEGNLEKVKLIIQTIKKLKTKQK
jgi:hypothetical protein